MGLTPYKFVEPYNDLVAVRAKKGYSTWVDDESGKPVLWEYIEMKLNVDSFS